MSAKLFDSAILGDAAGALGFTTNELERFGCDPMQGYLFSKPLTPEQVTALLEADSSSGKSVKIAHAH